MGYYEVMKYSIRRLGEQDLALIKELNKLFANVFEDAVKGIYQRINVSDDGKLLLGGILIGDAEAYNMLLQTSKNKIILPPNPEDLLLGARGGSAVSSNGVLSLPDDALICSCESVSKGAICAAVEAGNETLDAVKKCTKAGTCCGGCVPMVKDLISSTMKR